LRLPTVRYKAIERQADLMETTSKPSWKKQTQTAQSENVDALINSERAWVIVSRVGNPDTKYGLVRSRRAPIPARDGG